MRWLVHGYDVNAGSSCLASKPILSFASSIGQSRLTAVIRRLVWKSRSTESGNVWKLYIYVRFVWLTELEQFNIDYLLFVLPLEIFLLSLRKETKCRPKFFSTTTASTRTRSRGRIGRPRSVKSAPPTSMTYQHFYINLSWRKFFVFEREMGSWLKPGFKFPLVQLTNLLCRERSLARCRRPSHSWAWSRLLPWPCADLGRCKPPQRDGRSSVTRSDHPRFWEPLKKTAIYFYPI